MSPNMLRLRTLMVGIPLALASLAIRHRSRHPAARWLPSAHSATAQMAMARGLTRSPANRHTKFTTNCWK